MGVISMPGEVSPSGKKTKTESPVQRVARNQALATLPDVL
jgi:hypothetical protein